MAAFYDRIILTAPSEEKAAVYLQQLQRLKHRLKLPLLAESNLHCFADPAGVRIGSGAGTLHALLCLSPWEQDSLKSQRVLLIHSGGDARRSPAYSICGKAWITLFDDSDESKSSSALVQLIQQLSVLTSKLPIGSLVVACSDVLLTFDQLPFDMDLSAGSSIYLLVIPAPVSVAVNHGVVQYHNQELLKQSSALIKPVDLYLQKPSLNVLHAKSACYEGNDEEVVLVDSGVVIFTGEAFQSLLNLQHTSLVGPSRNSYHRFELYSELLLACRTTATNDQTLEDYLSGIDFANHSNTFHLTGLQQLWYLFRPFTLQFLLPPNGRFVHLGTTREILAFLSARPSNRVNKEIMLLNALCDYSSTAVSTCTANIGNKKTVLEHSICSNSSLKSPCGGFYSHIPHPNIIEELNLSAAPSFLMQWIPLRHTLNSVLLILDVNDDPKASFARGTMCGKTWNVFMERMNCEICDIWPEGSTFEGNTLWAAKVFPILNSSLDRLPLTNVFLEIIKIDDNCRDAWMNAERLSLSDLLNQGDAEAMFIWRTLLETFLEKYNQRGDSLVLYELIIFWRKLRLLAPEINLQRFVSGVLLLTLTQLVAIDINNDCLSMIASFTSISVVNLTEVCDEIKESVALTNISLLWPLWITLLVELIYDDTMLVSIFKVLFECIIGKNEVKEEQKAKILLILAHSLLFRHLSASISSPQALAMPTEEINSIAMSLSPIRSLLQSSAWLTGRIMDHITVEAIAQAVTRHQMNLSLQHHLESFSSTSVKPIIANKMTICTAPARVDLAGGWSDTPPICWDLPRLQNAAVLNMAVKVDGCRPLRATCSVLSGRVGITLQCLGKDRTVVIAEERCVTWRELRQVVDVTQSVCLLPKACTIVIFQLLFLESNSSAAAESEEIDLLATLQSCCGIDSNNGLLLTSQSELPAGSGMGGSSILAATILQALHYHLTQCKLTDEQLVYLVLQVEQLMTTGGGWQDQVGGVVGGIKIARSASSLPLTVTFNAINMSDKFVTRLAQRIILLYTGTQRLARDTLIQALRRYSVILPTVENNMLAQLVQTAEEGCTLLLHHASSAEDKDMMLDEIDDIIDQLGSILSRYWQQKVIMAPGSDPPRIVSILQRLSSFCVGMSLCGAGAGGFGMLILDKSSSASLSAVREEVDKMNLYYTREEDYAIIDEDRSRLTLHAVEVDMDGLQVEEVTAG